MQHSDVSARLSSAVSDAHKEPGKYGYYVGHDGDGSSGKVVFSSNGAMKQAPYSISDTAGKANTVIDHSKAKDVVPSISYKTKQAADDGTADADEAQRQVDGVRLVESAVFVGEVKLAEATSPTGYPIKLIQPGRGSSGYYPKEVLERDGPKIFKSGTQMFWNHATATEEAQRPEGDMDKLAAVLTSNAYYDESGKAGPGLYAHAKVMADYADRVAEKAKYTGLSIRARGHYAESKTAPDGKSGLIAKLSAADSVDFVTKPGAGGKVLTEAARSGQGDDMDEATLTRLVEAAVTKAVEPLKADNAKLKETLALQVAPRLIHEALADLRLPAASKKKIYERLTGENVLSMLPMKEGKLDAEAITKMVEAEAVREANFLMELGYGDQVPSRGTRMTEAELKENVKAESEERTQIMEGLADLFVGPKLNKGQEGRDTRKAARAAFTEGRAA